MTYIINNNENKDKELINNSKPIPMLKKSFPNNDKKEYQGSSKYKLGTCLIGKNFSSLIIRIFCSLNKNETKGFFIYNCTNDNRYPSLHEMAEEYNVKSLDELFDNYRILMIVRNPIDRLISGFMQLCYFRIYLKPGQDFCYGCDKNLTCFINKLQIDLWKVAKNEIIPDQFYDYHFYPQVWQCEYYKYKSKYTYIKYSTSNMESFYQTIIYYLENAHVPDNQLDYLNKFMHSFRTIHTTSTKNETNNYRNTLYEDSRLLRKVCRMFYYDFVEFDFELPKECFDI
uniref:Sulfotransfer_1 domain-containing protein n=1 Tax=Strongyloides venezuelensis TaxID=75913 RepID=A0A0K0FTN2_STRVS